MYSLTGDRDWPCASKAADCGEILPIERQRVEGAELHLLIVLTRVQGIEVRRIIEAKDYPLSVNRKLHLPVLQRGFYHQGKRLVQS